MSMAGGQAVWSHACVHSWLAQLWQGQRRLCGLDWAPQAIWVGLLGNAEYNAVGDLSPAETQGTSGWSLH